MDGAAAAARALRLKLSIQRVRIPILISLLLNFGLFHGATGTTRVLGTSLWSPFVKLGAEHFPMCLSRNFANLYQGIMALRCVVFSSRVTHHRITGPNSALLLYHLRVTLADVELQQLCALPHIPPPKREQPRSGQTIPLPQLYSPAARVEAVVVK